MTNIESAINTSQILVLSRHFLNVSGVFMNLHQHIAGTNYSTFLKNYKKRISPVTSVSLHRIKLVISGFTIFKAQLLLLLYNCNNNWTNIYLIQYCDNHVKLTAVHNEQCNLQHNQIRIDSMTLAELLPACWITHRIIVRPYDGVDGIGTIFFCCHFWQRLTITWRKELEWVLFRYKIAQ